MTINHTHLLITADVGYMPKNTTTMELWLNELVDLIGMKVLIPAQAIYSNNPGNDGMTAIVCIDTSHCSMHFWHKGKGAILKMDLYSCKTFDVTKVIDHLEGFAPSAISWTLLDRNGDTPRRADAGSINYWGHGRG